MIDHKPVAKRHLLDTKANLYKEFKKQNPTYNRKFVTFLSMIPKNYRILSETARRVCMCVKDYNLSQKIDALNAAVKSRFPHLKKRRRELSDITLCEYEDNNPPKKSCLERECNDCGVQKIEDEYSEVIEQVGDNEVKFKQWLKKDEVYVNRKNEKSKVKKWVQMESRCSVNELVGQIAEDMKLHSGHISHADFQHKVLNDLTSSQLPLDHAVAIMDFSENYSLMHQDQIESAYFSQKQITLHPVYLYRHAPDSTEENIKIQKEAIVMISDSLNHNSTAVYSFTCQLLKYIKNNPGACDVSVLHRFSDNCLTQYKCIESFTHLQMYEAVVQYYCSLPLH